jgi:hypothetical protein
MRTCNREHSYDGRLPRTLMDCRVKPGNDSGESSVRANLASGYCTSKIFRSVLWMRSVLLPATM